MITAQASSSIPTSASTVTKASILKALARMVASLDKALAPSADGARGF
jgi:hypothetical protein